MIIEIWIERRKGERRICTGCEKKVHRIRAVSCLFHLDFLCPKCFYGKFSEISREYLRRKREQNRDETKKFSRISRKVLSEKYNAATMGQRRVSELTGYAIACFKRYKELKEESWIHG